MESSVQGRRKFRKVGGGGAGSEGHFSTSPRRQKNFRSKNFSGHTTVFPKYEKNFPEIPKTFPDICYFFPKLKHFSENNRLKFSKGRFG
jgi:hypothetical protein